MTRAGRMRRYYPITVPALPVCPAVAALQTGYWILPTYYLAHLAVTASVVTRLRDQSRDVGDAGPCGIQDLDTLQPGTAPPRFNRAPAVQPRCGLP